MVDQDRWTIQIRKVTRLAGQLTRVWGLVYSSKGTAVGSIEFRGEQTSSLLALLQMSESVTVVDCSGPVRSSARGS